MYKKIAAVIVSIMMAVTVTACGNTADDLTKKSVNAPYANEEIVEISNDNTAAEDTAESTETEDTAESSSESEKFDKTDTSSADNKPIDQTAQAEDQTENTTTSVKQVIPEETQTEAPAQTTAAETTTTAAQTEAAQTSETQTSAAQTEQPSETEKLLYSSSVSSSFSGSSSGIIDTTDIFSDRDLLQTPDVSDAKYITVTDGTTIDITEAGTYVIRGTASECTIKVNADKDAKVQLVLNAVNITNSNFPAIYVVSADKCFVTTTETENSLSVTGTFTADGDTNTDAVIFSKDDLVLNGLGTLNISSPYGNGISGKDDLKVTGGTYNITSAKDSIEANNTILIAGGTFNITSSKDALHCENDDDQTLGLIFIADGTFNINAASDGIQGNTAVQIDGGNFSITSAEGIESTYVQINGGTINISASDDGINAAKKSSAYSTPTIEFNGGDITIVMGQGDTDAVDANGNIIVNGGTINITATVSSFDYDGTAQFNGGTIIINGSEVSEIPQSMMGGGRGGFGGGFGGDHGGRGGFGEAGFGGGAGFGR